VKSLAILAVLALPARADERGAFCEVTPCLKGPVTRRMLAANEVHGKVTCKKGHELGVDAQKRLVFCTIAKAVDVDGLAVKAGSYTLFHPNGRIYQTHLRAKYEATLADQTKVVCAANEVISRLDDGTLAFCDLAAPRAGSPRPRVGEGVSFHRNGRPAGMTLDDKLAIAGLEIPAGSSVYFDEKGTLLGGRLASAIKAGALQIRYELTLHPNGKLRTAELAADATIQGHALPEWAELEFRADGTLERAKFVEKRGTMPHGEEWTDTRHMTFDPKGKVTHSYLDHWQSDVRPPSATRRHRP
jgi:hypothetical protein